MIEQEAHDRLHLLLPKGSRVSISRCSWSSSVVGSGPVVHNTGGDWSLTVMIKAQLDEVEFVMGTDLEKVVEQMSELLARRKPPKLMAPSHGLFDDLEQAM